MFFVEQVSKSKFNHSRRAQTVFSLFYESKLNQTDSPTVFSLVLVCSRTPHATVFIIATLMIKKMNKKLRLKKCHHSLPPTLPQFCRYHRVKLTLVSTISGLVEKHIPTVYQLSHSKNIKTNIKILKSI